MDAARGLTWVWCESRRIHEHLTQTCAGLLASIKERIRSAPLRAAVAVNLAAADILKHPSGQPSIGLILCKTKKELVVEYALRNTSTPMGIAEFRHLEKLPDNLNGSLPTIEELEAEIGSATD